MKIKLAFLFLVTIQAIAFCSVYSIQQTPMATQQSVKIDASVNNIPDAFDATAGSQVMTVSLSGQQCILVKNITSTMISYVSADSVPSASTTERFYVPANTYEERCSTAIKSKIYIQSEGGSDITSGTVTVGVW
jgi:hypothetical protein